MGDRKRDLDIILRDIINYHGNESDLLVELINQLRPTKKQPDQTTEKKLDLFLTQLETDEILCLSVQAYIKRLVQDRSVLELLTEANLVNETNFWTELKDRIQLKFLPEYFDSTSAEQLIGDIFYLERDGAWVADFSDATLIKLFEILKIEGLYERSNQSRLIQELLFSAKVLAHRISGYTLHSDFIKLAPEYSMYKNPFISLQSEINALVRAVDQDMVARYEQDINYRQTIVLLHQCKDFIQKVYQNIPKYGIAYKEHQYLIMVEQLLMRLEATLGFIVIKDDVRSHEALLKFLKSIVLYNTSKSELKKYIGHYTQAYAKEISRNIALKGEQIISSGLKDFLKMFRAALGGGFIVAFACLFKMELSAVDTSLLNKAIFYSLNYSLAFILIYVFHFALATKQPAMTAATLAANIDNDLQKDDHFEHLSLLVAKIWRTQFIAFVGNVIMAFPVALVLVAGLSWLTGENEATYKAAKLIGDLDIFTSPAIPHAAIAGVFLFVSGMIAGSISNKLKVKKISARIIHHPLLKQVTSLETRNKIGKYIDHYWAGIVSNFWFGVFMGSVSIVGIIIGINLDIRHITFAAGNFALGLYGYGFEISTFQLIHSIIGIVVIGFVNFIVSFSLSLFLALRSRGIKFNQLDDVLEAIRKSFFANPMSFFFPSRKR